MKDDLLSQMTRALADEHDGATAVPEASRARIVRALAERRPRRRKWWAVGVPAFVLLGGSTAWAHATGHLPPIVEKAIATLTGNSPASHESNKPAIARKWSGAEKSHLSAPIVPTADDEPETLKSNETAEETAAIEESTLTPQLERTPSTRTPPSASSQATGKKSLAPEEDDSALLSYRAAHRAHFQEGNCGAAVTGYRKYLREQPSGSFALEAQYNLALCLIRQGMNAEAISLLHPFADGVHGDYRKKKSQELIQQLGN